MKFLVPMKMDLSCIMSVYISGLLGLKVVTYGMIFYALCDIFCI